jgi:hypothetical protein
MAGNIRPFALRSSTRLVEIAKLPVQQQVPALDQGGLPKRDEGPYLGRVYITPKLEKLASDLAFGQVNTQAELRCTIAALAAERYRLVHEKWPASLEALVPAFLKEMPTDPYDGQPLRFRQLPDGIVIYCVGPDRMDDGGKLGRGTTIPAGADVGIQLWDVDQRRLRAAVAR